MNKNLKTAIEDQVKKEFYSAYLYLALSSRMKDLSLDGFANWMRVQAQEEMAHATHLYDYLQDREEEIAFPAIESPALPLSVSALQAMEMTLSHEKFVTESINNLMALAVDDKDFASIAFLQWYVNEQVEEESTAKQILDKCKMVADSPSGLFMIDAELAARTFTDPFANQANNA